MKKVFTLTLLMIAISATTVLAQKGDKKINAGIDIGMPMGDFGKGYGVGFGATAKGLYGISDIGQITLTMGYIHFGVKDMPDGISGSIGMIPILGGYRHHFDKLYAEGQLGFTVVRSSIKFKGLEGIPGLGNLNSGGSTSNTNLGYGFGGGYLFDKWDLGLRFQGVSASGGSLSFVALRVGYSFAL